MGVIRVSEEVHRELERLRRRVSAKSMSDLIALLIELSRDRLDRFKGNPEVFLKTLKHAGEAGERDSERIDELLYGEGG